MAVRSTLLATALGFALTTGVAPARADDVARARKVFAEGVRLYRNGDWEGARRLFREADTEHHAPTIVYNIGLAEEKLGHPQAAVDLYEAYIAEGGDTAEFAASAAVAIAQIKARSTRLKLETTPPGGALFVDGAALGERAPTTLLVPAGHHVVVAQGDGWRDERTVEVRGAGDTLIVALQGPPPPPPSDAAPPPPPHRLSPEAVVTPPLGGTVADARDPGPEGLIWGAGFTVVPIYLLGVTNTAATNSRPAVSILAGALLEVGYALTDRVAFLGRGMVGLGPDGKPSYGYLGGPGLSYRVGSPLWIGATFIGGQIETRAHDARYGTDLVFGTMLEANVVVIRKPHGEWLAGIQPSVLLTQIHQDNTAFFFPISFGYRAY